MNRRILYIFFITLIALLIFAIAAVCNLCGIPISVGETQQTTTEVTEKETSNADSSGNKEMIKETPAEEQEDVIDEEAEADPTEEEVPEFTEDEVIINALIDESFYLINQDFHYGENWVFFGDDETDNHIYGYLAFKLDDLNNLADVTIIKAAVEISNVTIGHEPWLVPDEIQIIVTDEGDQVFAISPTDSITEINFSSAKLNEELQKRIGSQYFVIQFKMDNKSDNGIDDWYAFRPSNAILKVKYKSISNAL